MKLNFKKSGAAFSQGTKFSNGGIILRGRLYSEGGSKSQPVFENLFKRVKYNLILVSKSFIFAMKLTYLQFGPYRFKEIKYFIYHFVFDTF